MLAEVSEPSEHKELSTAADGLRGPHAGAGSGRGLVVRAEQGARRQRHLLKSQAGIRCLLIW